MPALFAGIPIELMTALGGSLVGFIFKYMAQRAADRQAQFEMMLKTIQTKDDSADRAAKRDPSKSGQWVRRVVVLAILFGVILAPFVLAIIGKPVIVEIKTPVREWLLGFLSTGGGTHFYELNSYILIPEVRQSLMAIIGFYFGQAAAKS